MTLKLLIPLLAFLLGWTGRRLDWLSLAHADRLLQTVVWIGLPAVVLGAVSNLSLTATLVGLPLSAMLIVLALWPVGFWIAKLLRLPPKRLAVVMLGAMIMNIAVVYPFCYVFWGAEGAALLALFDLGNGLVVLTLGYGLAAWYGQGGDWWRMLQSVLRFPPFVALGLALALNLSDIGLPERVAVLLYQLGAAWMLLVYVALGVYSVRSLPWTRELCWTVAARSLLGGTLGWLCARAFGLEGVALGVLVLGASAPVGFNTLVYATRQGLDRELAAELVCLSLMIGLLWLPLLALIIA